MYASSVCRLLNRCSVWCCGLAIQANRFRWAWLSESYEQKGHIISLSCDNCASRGCSQFYSLARAVAFVNFITDG